MLLVPIRKMWNLVSNKVIKISQSMYPKKPSWREMVNSLKTLDLVAVSQISLWLGLLLLQMFQVLQQIMICRLLQNAIALTVLLGGAQIISKWPSAGQTDGSWCCQWRYLPLLMVVHAVESLGTPWLGVKNSPKVDGLYRLTVALLGHSVTKLFCCWYHLKIFKPHTKTRRKLRRALCIVYILHFFPNGCKNNLILLFRGIS